MKQREPYFDNLKLVLIYLVVLGHFAETAEASSLAPMVRFFIYSFHMPLFIFVSGLFYDASNVKKAFQKCLGFFSLYVLSKLAGWLINAVLFKSMTFSLFNTGGMQWFLFAMAAWCLLTTLVYKYFDLKKVLIITVILALIVGYDDSINSMFMLSRIIVFWPFFIVGVLIDRDDLLLFVKKKSIMVISLIVLIIIAAVIFVYYDIVKEISPLLSGQNPYYKLDELAIYGCILRGIVYVVEVLLSIGVMAIVPQKEFKVTAIGQRTISIYFYDIIIYSITVYGFTLLHMWQYAVISLILVIILSRNVFYKPLYMILNAYRKNKL